ncbi:MAG: UDP-N-acetylmuramoyl-L-alanine--D-glutamate ligase, partial [Thermodesulfobacteriota bacterium]|nr:UDP-N-acetylmuramoyl-L-alanine--D-glutamate ligase [Thermodesulfobacteriota bacterium]
ELELAGRYVSERILAVTGTNGKTTTTALAGAVLKHIGRKVFVGGNIGAPLSEYVLGEGGADVLVLEVSSFQAQNCDTFKPDTAVLLNFSPNHLDFHADMDEYLQAKLNLFAHMEPFDVAILPVGMRDTLESLEFTRARRLYFESTDRFESDRLPGAHNQANMEAAYLACTRFGATQRDVWEVLENFSPLPHRLRKVAEKNGVLFVDDSKSTTVESLRAAISSFERPILLLAGGVFKGGDLASLVPLLRRKVRRVCLFGQSRGIFEKAWAGHVPLTWEPDLRRAVASLRSKAESGDVVLLSPATASFDLYSDYKARGRDFQRIIGGVSEA